MSNETMTKGVHETMNIIVAIQASTSQLQCITFTDEEKGQSVVRKKKLCINY